MNEDFDIEAASNEIAEDLGFTVTENDDDPKDCR